MSRLRIGRAAVLACVVIIVAGCGADDLESSPRGTSASSPSVPAPNVPDRAAPAVRGLDVNGEPHFETVRLSSGFANDPYEIRIPAAGGSADTSALPPQCRDAAISARPDVRLIYNAGTTFPLNIYAYSRTDDLFLVVQLPSGEFRCNDDYDGLDPAVLLSNPRSGTYNIWLGVYDSGFGSGTLAISELEPRFR